MYLTSANLRICANLAIRRINNLRSLNSAFSSIPARLPGANPLADTAFRLPRKEHQGSDNASLLHGMILRSNAVPESSLRSRIEFRLDLRGPANIAMWIREAAYPLRVAVRLPDCRD